ncbi:hypothetical protein D3C87_1532250 [compost metagenome]
MSSKKFTPKIPIDLPLVPVWVIRRVAAISSGTPAASMAKRLIVLLAVATGMTVATTVPLIDTVAVSAAVVPTYMAKVNLPRRGLTTNSM